jgi:hypothetical protein
MSTTPQVNHYGPKATKQFAQGDWWVGEEWILKSGRVSLIDFIISRNDIKFVIVRLNGTAKDRQKNVENI